MILDCAGGMWNDIGLAECGMILDCTSGMWNDIGLHWWNVERYWTAVAECGMIFIRRWRRDPKKFCIKWPKIEFSILHINVKLVLVFYSGVKN